MKKSTKTLIIIISTVTLLGAVAVAGTSGFFVGRRYERRQALQNLDMSKERFRRIGQIGKGMIKDRMFGGAHVNGMGPFQLRSNSLAGIVLEVDENSEAWLVLMPPGFSENVWKIQITSETKITRGGDSVEVSEISEGDFVMAVGEKDGDESTLKAESIKVRE